MWELSKKNPEYLNTITKEQIEAIPNRGDGKAVFFGEGTEEEWKEEERERKGFKGIFGIGS